MAAEQPAPALKEIFNPERLEHIATEMSAVYPEFNAGAFLKMANEGLAVLHHVRLCRVRDPLLPAQHEFVQLSAGADPVAAQDAGHRRAGCFQTPGGGEQSGAALQFRKNRRSFQSNMNRP